MTIVCVLQIEKVVNVQVCTEPDFSKTSKLCQSKRSRYRYTITAHRRLTGTPAGISDKLDRALLRASDRHLLPHHQLDNLPLLSPRRGHRLEDGARVDFQLAGLEHV